MKAPFEKGELVTPSRPMDPTLRPFIPIGQIRVVAECAEVTNGFCLLCGGNFKVEIVGIQPRERSAFCACQWKPIERPPVELAQSYVRIQSRLAMVKR